MAEPIDHDALSATTTAGVETVKGISKGFALVVAVPALALGLIFGGIAAAFGGAIVATGAIGALIGIGLGVTASIMGSTPIIATGALLGLHRGGTRIAKEQAMYRERVAGSSQNINGKMNETAQAAFTQGVQAGQQSMVQELQKAQYMALQQQMEAGPKTGFADKIGKPCASKTEMIEQQAAAAAAAQPAR